MADMREETADRANSPASGASGFRGSGGTDGGVGMFFLGLVLSGVSLWLFLDSVQVGTQGNGWFTNAILRLTHGPGQAGGGFQTTSMGIIFVPFFIGVFTLFYDARLRWAWWLTGVGVAIVVLEILSRIQFMMSMKTSHLLLMIATFAAGAALMMRSYRAFPPVDDSNSPTPPKQKQP